MLNLTALHEAFDDLGKAYPELYDTAVREEAYRSVATGVISDYYAMYSAFANQQLGFLIRDYIGEYGNDWEPLGECFRREFIWM